MKFTPTFKLKYKSKLSNLAKNQLERSLKWLGVARRGL